MHKTGTIYGINGPVIYLKGNTGFQMAEMVYVGKRTSGRRSYPSDKRYHDHSGLRGNHRTASW